MSSKLFVLGYSYYEEYVPYFLHGPEDVTQEEFKALCDSLLEEAGYRAVANADDSWVGWQQVVESLIPLLEQQGYQRFEPVENIYWGPGIIDEHDYNELSLLKSSQSKIIEFNKEIHDKLYKDIG
jgi:hypothetical protein